MKSLKFKILLPIIMLVVIGFSALLSISFFRAHEMLDSDVENYAKTKVEKLVISTEDLIHQCKEKVHIFSTIEIVKHMDFSSLKVYIEENKQIFQDFDTIVLSDTKGK